MFHFLSFLLVLHFSAQVAPENVTTSINSIDCECGVANVKTAAGRIVNGVETLPNQYPWMAAMFDGFGKFTCGGSVISDRHILTAAHCVGFNPKANQSFFKLGIHNKYDVTAKKYEIEKIIIDPSYRSLKFYEDYDMALVLLKDTIEFSKSIRPICLPNNDDDVTGKIVFVAGWGKLSDISDTSSRYLQETNIVVMPFRKCQQLYSEVGLGGLNPESMICGISPLTDACNGDSGGPLFIEKKPNKFVIHGTVSFGYGCARKYPGVYAKVTSSVAWIKNTIASTGGKLCKT